MFTRSYKPKLKYPEYDARQPRSRQLSVTGQPNTAPWNPSPRLWGPAGVAAGDVDGGAVARQQCHRIGRRGLLHRRRARRDVHLKVPKRRPKTATRPPTSATQSPAPLRAARSQKSARTTSSSRRAVATPRSTNCRPRAYRKRPASTSWKSSATEPSPLQSDIRWTLRPACLRGTLTIRRN